MESKMTPFQEELQQCLATEKIPIYDAFLQMSKEKAPPDARERYLRLRTTGFVAQDEQDVDVYTEYVAEKHRNKFGWLYENLFKTYHSVFTSPIEVVVWGCGCGLDLIALYDRAKKQGNPNFWLVVQAITLVDISKSAIQRAKEIAEVLFPVADIKCFVLDLKDIKRLEESQIFEPLFPYVTRVHLLSNVLDLFEDVRIFSSVLRKMSVRVVQSRNLWNELFVVFSPEYRKGKVRQNLEQFREVWNGADDLYMQGEAPQNCEYAAFAYNRLKGSPVYHGFESGNLFVRRMVGRLIGEEEKNWGSIMRLMRALCTIKVSGELLFPEYEYFDDIGPVKTRGKEHKCVVCVPDRPMCSDGSKCRMKPFIVVFKDDCQNDEEDCQNDEELPLRAAQCFFRKAKTVLDEGSMENNILRIRLKRDEANKERQVGQLKEKLVRCVNLAYWDGETLLDLNRNPLKECVYAWRSESDIDYSRLYCIDPDGIEALPPLSREQRVIAESRTQLKKIKGGPGVGKTVTMLWHACKAVERTHLPALIVCKTVSLINYNRRRLAATYIENHLGVKGMDANLFRFETIDDFLCKYVKSTSAPEGCALQRHGRCMANQEMGEAFMASSCRKCKANVVKMLKRKNQKRTWEEKIGSVMVDEAQIVDPEYVKAVYNLTQAGNRFREFYVFCDAQQAFRHKTLEQDTVTKKWNVVMPDTGFGDWVLLRQNWRVKSQALIEACRIVQQRLKGRDSELTLFDWCGLSIITDSSGGAFGIRVVRKPSFAFVEKEVDYLRGKCGAESVTVICEEQAMARTLAKEALEKKWIVTHLPKENYSKEKELRRDFHEYTGANHLTTVDCAQGQSFETVIFVLTSNRDQSSEGALEQVFTALSRSGRYLRVFDASPKHWLYDLLEFKK